MKSYALSLFVAFTLVIAGILLLPAASFAQSLTTGSITGTITDPTGAAVPTATVTLKNNDTGATQDSTSNSTGAYRFALLNPGNYSVSVKAQGFQGVEQNVAVAVGQSSTVDLKLNVASASTTVEVTAQGSVLQTDNGNVSTTISPEIVANMPNPGNDLSYYVQTAPGTTMNTQGGYGNSATFGISATSNLFTVDGMNENDPFLNLNNSGATNLLLGANDVQTATVVNNGYTGEYGTLAGANVNYVTKSGTNKLHGNLEYFWNGRVLNANDWFLNNSGVPRSFDNANQWSASIGGPIKKDKTFFFLDTEGLRLLIPTSQPVNIPSPQFQAATLASIPASEVPFYNQTFGLFNNAPGASTAANTLPAGGCDGTVTLAGGAPCALKFQSNVSNLTTEWLLTARVDQNFGTRDRAFIHFRTDHGLQASITDPFSPALNAQSVQPQYEGQLQETHQVGSNAVNQFILAGSWYSAVFGPPSLAKATAIAPYDLDFSGGFFTTPGNSTFYTTWPQGRNVTQYQVSDDYGWQKGAHNLKFGVNFRRNDLTDYTPGGFNSAIPLAVIASENSFMTGTVDTFQQGFAARPTQPLAIYSLGLYAQDEWAVRRSLKVTLSLRAQHNSNPVCQTNCFARLDAPFLTASHDPTQPYNQAIRTGLHQALPDLQAISWEPRIGFAWQPLGRGNTVVRGGFGIFSDVFPGTVATSFDTNSPLKNTFLTTGLLAPGVPGNAQSAAVASNAAFASGFASGLTFAQIQASLPAGAFSPPAFTNSESNIRYPKYEEWNFEVQQALGTKNSLTLNYVGNHGYDLAATNVGLNGYCDPITCAPGLGATSFVGLPAAPLDARFSTVTEVGNYGISNYNGLTASFTRRVSNSFQLQASYTWSHALDDVSNGGFLPFNLGTNVSVLTPQDPYCFRCYNYGNADYDVRHQANLTYTYQTPKLQNRLLDLLANWSISGTLFVRSGLPFTVIDGADTGTLNGFNYGNTLFADSNVGPLNCSSSAVFNNFVTTTPCMSATQFTAPLSATGAFGFGNQRRNQGYGPMYFNTDLALMKNFRIPKWEGAELQIGAQAFNILNHPNFDQPVGDISNPQFGFINRTVATPTSIFGSFLGADASPRALQIRAQLRF
ncbi:MAG TPA: carboxypeptidase regulatory-like domain-containing protein [Candidatus Eisenbacteria bacterium]|nr:carboxypeptidase regulatory-like domain-containing protein [Candidatus Eisenbacteria bacterium]